MKLNPNRRICSGDGGPDSRRMMSASGQDEFILSMARKAHAAVALMPIPKVIWMASKGQNEVYREAALARVVKEGLK